MPGHNPRGILVSVNEYVLSNGILLYMVKVWLSEQFPRY